MYVRNFIYELHVCRSVFFGWRREVECLLRTGHGAAGRVGVGEAGAQVAAAAGCLACPGLLGLPPLFLRLPLRGWEEGLDRRVLTVVDGLGGRQDEQGGRRGGHTARDRARTTWTTTAPAIKRKDE